MKDRLLVAHAWNLKLAFHSPSSFFKNFENCQTKILKHKFFEFIINEITYKKLSAGKTTANLANQTSVSKSVTN